MAGLVPTEKQGLETHGEGSSPHKGRWTVDVIIRRLFVLVGLVVLALGASTRVWASDGCKCDVQWKNGNPQCNAGSCTSGSCQSGGTWSMGHAGSFYCGCATVGTPPTIPDYCSGSLQRSDNGGITATFCDAIEPCPSPKQCVQGNSQCPTTLDWTECRCLGGG